MKSQMFVNLKQGICTPTYYSSFMMMNCCLHSREMSVVATTCFSFTQSFINTPSSQLTTSYVKQKILLRRQRKKHIAHHSRVQANIPKSETITVNRVKRLSSKYLYNYNFQKQTHKLLSLNALESFSGFYCAPSFSHRNIMTS